MDRFSIAARQINAIRYRLPDNHQNGPFRGPFFIVFPTRP